MYTAYNVKGAIKDRPMEKRCKECNKKLKQRADEYPYIFKRRVFCNRDCSTANIKRKTWFGRTGEI